MNEERMDRIEARLAAVEQAVDRIAGTRLRLLSTATAVGAPVQAPPIQVAPPRFDLPPVRQVEPKAVVEDGEYQLGAQWLPRIGAGLLVLGIAYLIGLAVTRGWITPSMLFGGAIVLCLSFIGLGQWLRDTKEEFGQILTGVGSCGMFLTLAGGHVYQNLYSGETMVAGFVAWSLVNLAYAFWQNSRSFLAIGVIGGFLASVMPLSKDAYVLSLTLHAAILIVSAAIVAKQKLEFAAVGLWISSGLALAPILTQLDFSWSVRVGAVYASSFVCLVTYLQSRGPVRKEEERFFVGLFVGVATLVAFAIKSEIQGTYHVLIAVMVCRAMALIYQKDAAIRSAFLYVGVALAAILAPFGLEREAAVYVHAGLAVVAGLTAAFAKRDEGNTFASILLVCAGSSFFLLFQNWNTEVQGQTEMLLALLAASIALAVGVGKREDDPRLALAWLAGWVLISRLGTLWIAMPSDFKMASFGVTLSWIVFGSILLVIGFLANLKQYRYAALAVLMVSVGKVLLIDMATSTPELRVTVLMGVGLALLAGGYAYIRRRAQGFDEAAKTKLNS